MKGEGYRMHDIKKIMEEYSDEYNLNGKPIKQGFKKQPKAKANDYGNGKKKGGHRKPHPNKIEFE